MSIPEYFELEGGDRMPRIGFGTWQAADDVLEKSVDAALEAGYRHFDTARAYENEAALGRALNRWIADDPARRKQLFVVTKLPPGGNRPELVQEYFDASLRDLNLDYVDLYLIHTPFAFEHVPGDLHPKNPDGSMKVDHSTNLLELWKTLLKLKESGRVRHVGVSNLNAAQLRRVCDVARPACLQVEVHALCQQPGLAAAAKKLGVPIVAYSPLGSKALADALAAKTGYCDSIPGVWRVWQACSIFDHIIAYHQGYRALALLRLPPYCSASGMFADAHTDDYFAIMRKKVSSVVRRVRGSSNSILMVFADRREYPDLLQLPVVTRIAQAHGRTSAQVLLRYTLQRGLGAIPKSTNPARIKQNISLWDFELKETEMSELASLDRGEDGRICDFAFFPGIDKHPEFPFKK